MRERLLDLKIGVLMGGLSREREISLRSGGRVLDSLIRQGFDAVGLDVDHQIWETLKSAEIDLAFIALHGRYGEDGSIQGLLELAGLPFTGSGVMASALGMNKVATKRILSSLELPSPAYHVVDIECGVDAEVQKIIKNIGLPVVVKPVSEGSSIGITIAESGQELNDIVRAAVYEFGKIYCEQYIAGREITVGVLGTNGSARALPVLELRPKRAFYDYEAKYTAGMTDFVLPAEISPELTKHVQDIAVSTHRALGCAGMSRVDMMLNADDAPYVLEVNTIPGFTETSDLPAQAKAAGISFDDLIFEIMKSAFVERHPNRTNAREDAPRSETDERQSPASL
jgi:D-alanine-D-alanine ligase